MWAQRNAALLVAARRGDWEKVKGLLSEGAGLRLNQTGNGGMSLLMLAARAGAADVCASLLASRADPGSREAASGSTALVLAAGAPERKGGDVPAVLRALLGASADPEAGNKAGRTALMVAAEAGSTDRVRALLEGGADPNAIALPLSDVGSVTGLKAKAVNTFIHGRTVNPLATWTRLRRAEEEEEEKNRHAIALLSLQQREAEMKLQMSALPEEVDEDLDAFDGAIPEGQSDRGSEIFDDHLHAFDRLSDDEAQSPSIRNYYDDDEDASSSEADDDWRAGLTMFVSDVAPLRMKDLRRPELTPEELADRTAASAALRGLMPRGDGDAEVDYTALVGAARGGHGAVCAMLVERGADVGLGGVMGEAALCAAASGGHHEVCALLLGAGRLPWEALAAATEMADAHGHEATASLLRGYGLPGTPQPV